jgi:hypothetical protein
VPHFLSAESLREIHCSGAPRFHRKLTGACCGMTLRSKAAVALSLKRAELQERARLKRMDGVLVDTWRQGEQRALQVHTLQVWQLIRTVGYTPL